MAEKQRPGVMIYFSVLPVLDALSTEQAGALFKGIMSYAAYGEFPTFDMDPMLTIAWAGLQGTLDRDAESYQAKCQRNAYNRYCGVEKKAGRDPLTFDEWNERQRSSTVVNERDQLQYNHSNNSNLNSNPISTPVSITMSKPTSMSTQAPNSQREYQEWEAQRRQGLKDEMTRNGG